MFQGSGPGQRKRAALDWTAETSAASWKTLNDVYAANADGPSMIVGGIAAAIRYVSRWDAARIPRCLPKAECA